MPPLFYRLPKVAQPDSAEVLGIAAEISVAALEQRARARHVALGMMMKRHRDLNQPLQESFLRPNRGPPNVLPRLVSFKERGLIEKDYSSEIELVLHKNIHESRAAALLFFLMFFSQYRHSECNTSATVPA